MKHAYLIIAHNKIEQLKFLISLLDHEKHDIYILLDKKAGVTSKIKKEIQTSVVYSNLYFTKKIPVYWGHYSQIDAELILFEKSSKQEEYSFYHLISGADLPLVTAEKLYESFQKHIGKNLLDVSTDVDFEKNNIHERFKYYRFFTKLTIVSFSSRYLIRALGAYRKFERGFQKIIQVNRLKKFKVKCTFYGSNWVSLNHETVLSLVKEKEWIKKVFYSSYLGDEVFLPVFLEKNNLKDTLYKKKSVDNSKEDSGSLRYIDWKKGGPYVFTPNSSDIKELRQAKKNGNILARKFDLDLYPEMKEKILKIINEENE